MKLSEESEGTYGTLSDRAIYVLWESGKRKDKMIQKVYSKKKWCKASCIWRRKWIARSRNSINSKEVEPPKIHNEAHYNHIVKSQRQRILKAAKKK